MRCLCPACEHSTASPPGSRLLGGQCGHHPAEVGLPSPCHHQHHCALCNVTTTRPQQAAAPAVVCLLRVFLLTADLLFRAWWWWPAGCRWRYANYTEVCHYNVTAQHRSPGQLQCVAGEHQPFKWNLLSLPRFGNISADSAQFSLLHEMPIFGREDPKLKYGRFQRKT